MTLLLGACHDELLNPIPESVLTTKNFFNTAKDMDMAVLGIYNRLQSMLPHTNQVGCDLDLPVLRFGEMILLYSEVLYELQQPNQALIQLNRIRERIK